MVCLPLTLQALTALFRRACAADQPRVLVWIRERLQQQLHRLQELQQLQQQHIVQQRGAEQQELSALLHMLLILLDDINGAAAQWRRLCLYLS